MFIMKKKANKDNLENNTQEIRTKKYFNASQSQLIWWRFKKHRLAIIGMIVLGFFLIVILFAEFLAPYNPQTRNTRYTLGPPQTIRFFDQDGNFRTKPFIYGSKTERHSVTLRMVFTGTLK